MIVMKAAPEGEGMYDFAPIAADPVVAAAPMPLPYQRPQAVVTAPGAVTFDRTKDIHIPVALIAVGLLVEFGELYFRSPVRVAGGMRAEYATKVVMIGLAINVALMLGGMLAACWQRGISLGPFWIAILKLCGITLAPAAAYTLITVLFPFGGLAVIAGFIVSFCLYFALIGALFDLDESDTWYCVVVIFLLRVLSAIALYFVLS